MSYSRRQLYAMGEPLGESVTRKEGGRIIYGGGGGGGPSTTTVNQSNIPEWLRPQVETVLGGGMKELFKTKEIPGVDGAPSTFEIVGTKPFTPYSANVQDYVAGFSPLQQQVQADAANLQLPGQFAQATGFANQAAQGGVDSAGRAYGYGNAGFQSGQQGQLMGMQGGDYYGNMGAKAGQQGQLMGMQGGDYYGNMGAKAGVQGQQSGLLGQQLGMQGGDYYGSMGAGYGQQGAGYGAQASDIGQMGLRAEQYGRNVSGQAEDYARDAAAAGSDYAKAAQNVYDPKTGQYIPTSAISAYMSPYLQNVTNIQLEGLQRQADIARTQRGSQAARAGAYGGSRQAIENAEANRALQSQMDNVRAQGLQQAYQEAQRNLQYGSNLGLQGLQGANQGLGTALQGGQLGLSGIGTALQGLQGGMQGSGLGLQGAQAGLQGLNAQLAGTAQGMQGSQAAMQGAGVGLSGIDRQLAGTAQGMQGAGIGLQGVDRQLAGTAQGMQGAQVGLQGVTGAQAGYGLANQAAANLSNIGTAQLAGQTGILGLQNQIGGQQQSQEQQIINQAIQNYAQAQEAPMQSLNQFNALLRGYALPGTTSTQYQAQPTLINQVAGLGTAGVGALALNNAMNPSSGSDIRIKQNIEHVGTLANGLGLYEFDYKPEFKDHPLCGHGRFRGVMAQEVEKLIPEAVVTMDNGYKAVKYDLVEMELS